MVRLVIGAALALPAALLLQPVSAQPLRVGISGNEPFLIQRGDVLEGGSDAHVDARPAPPRALDLRG